MNLDASARPGTGWVIVNEDNDHYFKVEKTNDHWPVLTGDAQMTVEALEAYADMITASGKVTHVFWCTCGERPNFDSRSWEPIWYPLSQKDADFTVIDCGSRVWPENALLLHQRGIDPYKVWIDRCRKNGAEAWVSMRMNDVHHLWRPKYFRNTIFCDSHPEMNVSRDKNAQWDLASMDYSFAEVREHHMKMFRELVDRYDADGIEMDFCRSGTYFPEGKGAESAGIMTDFIREAAEYAKAKRGNGYGVAVRTHPRPGTALSHGFDFAEIAKKCAVDVVIPCLYGPVGGGWTIDFDAWKKVLADNPEIVLVGGTTTTFGGPYHDAKSLAGWSASMRDLGWENLYLFNFAYMSRETRDAGYKGNALYAKAGDDVPRTFLFEGRGSSWKTPMSEKLDKPFHHEIVLPAGIKARTHVDFVAEFGEGTLPPSVRLNGRESSSFSEVKRNGYRMARYVLPVDAIRPGRNTVDIAPQETDASPILRAAIDVL